LRECGVPRRKRATFRIVDRMVIGVRVDQSVPGREKAGPCPLRAGLERCAAWVTRLPSSMPLACSLGETALVRDEGVCLAREPSTMNRRCRAGAIHKFNNEGDVSPAGTACRAPTKAATSTAKATEPAGRRRYEGNGDVEIVASWGAASSAPTKATSRAKATEPAGRRRYESQKRTGKIGRLRRAGLCHPSNRHCRPSFGGQVLRTNRAAARFAIR